MLHDLHFKVCSARRSNLLPDKVADLMLLKLNSKSVESIKAKKSIEPTYTASQIKNLINVEFEDNEDDDPTEEVEYIEDIEDNDTGKPTVFLGIEKVEKDIGVRVRYLDGYG